jgi:hypothetical protein
MSLSKEQRKALPDSDFAVPGKRKLPIHDATHTRQAWDMVDRTGGLSDADRSEARTRILDRAKEQDVDTEDWDTGSKAVTASALLSCLSAMAIEMPDVKDHPNRMPFKGVMTFVNQPSDMAVGGAGGKRVYMPKDVAEQMLPSLMGMGIDYTPNFDGHDAQKKVGLITGAEIVGDELRIEGFFYAADFPQVCKRIKAEKEDLGFSYEIKAQTLPMVGDLLQIVGGTFTGAAVLYKDKAAYQQTSLAANADQELDMTPEEIKKLFGEVLAPLAASVEGVVKKVDAMEAKQLEASKTADMVRPHAETLRNCAASMEAAGIGGDPNRGHVKVLNHMANQMEADGVMGKVPHIYRDHDFMSAKGDQVVVDQTAAIDAAVKKALEPVQAELAAAKTKVADLEAKGFSQAQQPTRETRPVVDAANLLKKYSLTANGEGKISVADLDKSLTASGMDRQQRIAVKIQMSNAGLIAA